MLIKKIDSINHSRDGVDANYFQLPNAFGGSTIARAKFTGEHGERTLKDGVTRAYYIISGSAKFKLNENEFVAEEGDLFVIEPNSTYNLWPMGESVDVLLISELLDLSGLPKK